ncbi:hypothetical protein RBB50_002183 [Rhinocladiella similis]
MNGDITVQRDSTTEDSRIEVPRSNERSTSPGYPEIDDFGLPKKPVIAAPRPDPNDSDDDSDAFHDAEATNEDRDPILKQSKNNPEKDNGCMDEGEEAGDIEGDTTHPATSASDADEGSRPEKSVPTQMTSIGNNSTLDGKDEIPAAPKLVIGETGTTSEHNAERGAAASPESDIAASIPVPRREKKPEEPAVSSWSHQRQLAAKSPNDDEEEEEEWQAMPALDEFDIYDDNGRLVARGNKQIEQETNAYSGIGGAGKGYTKLQLDEDAQSATSMDEDTNYLFQNGEKSKQIDNEDEDEDEQRDALAQLQATKDLLTEGQRIAYVGVVRLTIHKMFNALGNLEKTRSTRSEMMKALESMDMWGQALMLRLYAHMDIDPAEQIMIEQLAEHGVEPSDLVTPLMINARVANPMANERQSGDLKPDSIRTRNSTTSRTSITSDSKQKEGAYQDEEVPEVHGPEDMPHSKQIELDLRWTVLCDLFLVLISGSDYDARSRRLLERVGSAMQITWVQICRFEKRVIDSLEMQEDEQKENWDESENLEKRRKSGLKRKYMYMGLATVGGGLVIGLSAGLLAPVIGAGLAAGFTTIGVTGTAGFLGGVGGAALITSAATAAGGTIAVRASDRRTGHVKTFEYRPLHNNKRLNLILTVAGWMNGKVDDVRLPYSTIDPIMGDIYSLLWEPEMLQSMGETINILATEALTQTIQQVLGSTILITLMAAIQLPVILSKLAYLIDNPWSVSLDRANAAGLILADSLIDRHLGQRPITLVGFSLGARVIFSCLKELSRRGAYGLVQNVYLFGSPIVSKKEDYLRARSVVSGRFLNGYASNDWILGYLFRATAGGIMRVAGLAAVEGVAGVENIDVSSMVNGHMAYRAAMPRLMREVGWEVESDEFTEIEDPDPDNHAKRQRELIQEIDEARKKAEEKPDKTRFGFFKRGKLADKKGWETYDASTNQHRRSSSLPRQPGNEGDINVLFDIDAIRKELESEMIEVRELDSTLPPMQITTIQNGEKHVEYLRLPPNMKPEEMARMNLPPRPDEIDVRFPEPVPVRPARVSSLRPSAQSSPQRSPWSSPQRSPQRSPGLDGRSSFAYSEPRELVSTMPPLTLSPSLNRTESHDASSITQPDLKQHATEPSATEWHRFTTPSTEGLSSPTIDLDLERNAWADDKEPSDRDRGGISMVFE